MAAGDGGILPPVIVSSNRFNDIRPYCDVLFQEDPKLWAQIMPNDFPQDGSKEAEEAFLSKFFTESEIHVQGFRFLKQVWYTIAIYNWETRIPLVVEHWFNGHQEELSGLSAYVNKPDVAVGTFFQDDEIELYGEKFLEIAYKAIQYRHQNPDRFKSASLPAEETGASDTPMASAVHVSPESTSQEAAAKMPQTQAASSFVSQGGSVTPLMPGGRISSSDFPLPAAPTQTAGPYGSMRKYSSSRYSSSEHAHAASHRRGSYSKRNSIHDRSGARMPPTAPHFAVGPQPNDGPPGASGYYPQHHATIARTGESSQFNNSSNLGPVTAGPQASAYGQYVPGAQIIAENPSMYAVGPHHSNPACPPSAYGRNGHGGMAFNQESFGGQQPVLGCQGDESLGKRRQSFSYRPRGGRILGNNRGRGKDSRASNSSDHYGKEIFNRKTSVSGDGSGSFTIAKNRRSSTSHHTTLSSWRNGPRDENYDPGFNRLQARGPQEARFPPVSHVAHPYPPPAVDLGQNTAYSYRPTRGHDATAPTGAYGVPVGDYGCSSHSIGGKCTFATKLIVFSVPTAIPPTEIQQFFESFGPTRNISQPSAGSSLHSQEGYTHLYVDFVDSSSARNCLEFKDMVWPGGPKFQVEVAKEHWDPDHAHFVPRAFDGTATGPPKKFAANSINTMSGQRQASYMRPAIWHPPSQLYDPYAEARSTVGSVEHLSEQTTPAVSNAATPKGKNKKNTRTVKAKTKAEKDKQSDSSPPGSSEAHGSNVKKGHEMCDEIDDGSEVSTGKAAVKSPMVQNPVSQFAFSQRTADDVQVKFPPVSVKAADEVQPPAHFSSRDDAPFTPVVEKAGDAKIEEDPAEDSFHTAHNTPDRTIDPASVPDVEGHQISNNIVPSYEKTISEHQTAENKNQGPQHEVTPESSAAGTSMSLDHSQSIGSRVQIVSPSQQEKPSEAISGTSPAAASSTVSSTPNDRVVSKKPVKTKGVAQTESLNPFGKPKKTKTKKTPATRKVTGTTVQLPKPDDIPLSKDIQQRETSRQGLTPSATQSGAQSTDTTGAHDGESGKSVPRPEPISACQN